MRRDLGTLIGREHDLLVIGGGIYGAAAAWDAAQRGLAVALVEARDFGCGVSWNSLKTIHGGLRHLQRGEVDLLLESVRERRALLRIAPEIVRPLPFLLPVYGHGLKGREALAVGLRLNDLLAFDRNRGLPPERRIPPGNLLSRREVLEIAPVPERGLTGGGVWTDAQVTSSERLLLGFLHAASSAGAVLANDVEVTGFLRCRERIAGVRARDARTGSDLEVRARLVLNAAGPGMDPLLALAGLARPPVPLLWAINLVLGRPVVSTHALGAAAGGRHLFLVPWRDRAIVGTEYGPPSEGGNGRRVAAFLDDCRRAYPWAGISAEDVTLVHGGLVPGRSGTSLWTRSLVVDHEAEEGVPGLVSVLGVKYTTARGVAEKAVDLVLGRLGRPAPPCRTHETLLPLARPLEGPLEERTIRAVRGEMAVRLSDAVLRRLDLGTSGPPADADLDAVVRIMASELAWDADRTRDERRALAATYSRQGLE